MIPKSGCRFSEKIMLKRISEGFDPVKLDHTLRMPMKKKTRAAAAAAAKRRKNAVAERQRARWVNAPASSPRLSVPPNDARLAVRRLRAQLAQALARIEELRASADTDFLLDIPNRRGFERELNRSIAYIKRYHASGALIVLDVDRLKPINDAFGHAAGDQVLRAIVDALSRQIRSSDVIGRLGGDEFALLLWNLSETDARAKAASLEQAVDRLSFTFRGRAVAAGASAGVAILGPHAEAGRALEEADSAMYLRKAQRRHEA
jgi:diguanylate cyclase (GGDEF)-like protein